MNNPECRWEPDEDGVYKTDCGQEFVFIDDGPKENHMRYCCYCGKTLRAKPVRESSTMREVQR